MKVRNLFILGMVLLGFTYCSSDDVLDGPTTGSGETADNLKMEVAIKMPTGASTRSKTGATGTEAGTTEENKTNSVLIVLVDESGKIAGTYNSAENTAGSDVPGATFFTTAQFKMDALKAGAKFDVYAFVNPYEGLLTNYPVAATPSFNTEAEFVTNGGTSITTVKGLIDAVTKKDETRNNFFMSNANEVQTVTVKATHIQGAPLKVGINVQRAVARMDYVDRTEGIKEGETEKKYIIPNAATIDGKEITVTFEKFKPMNVSKSFFDLKRVNTSGAVPTTDALATIGGAETATNYVVDTDWGYKIKPDEPNTLKSLFHSYHKSATTESVEANYKKMATEKFYVTENTIPKSAENKKGIATAVVFKGYLNFGASYITAADESGMVYVWNNKFYGSFDNLPAGIQAIAKDADGNKRTDLDEVNKDLASAGVTGYAKDTAGKYPIYYVYYNVHNQNDSKSGFGPMEFGVVRNNIYKLTINNLSKFGHPNDPEDSNPTNPDPNPEKPEDPIKSSDLYMQVTATVLDWTVRTNNIEF